MRPEDIHWPELSTLRVPRLRAFASAEKGERFPDAAGNAVAAFIHEFDGWQFQTRSPVA